MFSPGQALCHVPWGHMDLFTTDDSEGPQHSDDSEGPPQDGCGGFKIVCIQIGNVERRVYTYEAISAH